MGYSEETITVPLAGSDWTLDQPKIYMVLGSHRSGTSFVANAIRDQGIYFGTGGWRAENGRFHQINKAIIAEAGGNWLNPPNEGALLAAGLLKGAEIEAVVQDFNNRANLWGWKDPRACLTARAWLDFMTGDVYLISVFRRPEQVADSLMRMGQIGSKKHGVNLAREYARRTVNAIKEFMGI